MCFQTKLENVKFQYTLCPSLINYSTLRIKIIRVDKISYTYSLNR